VPKVKGSYSVVTLSEYFVSGDNGQAETCELQPDKMHYLLSIPRDHKWRHILQTVNTLRLFVEVMFRTVDGDQFIHCARHSSPQFVLGNITNERLLIKSGNYFGLYGVL